MSRDPEYLRSLPPADQPPNNPDRLFTAARVFKQLDDHFDESTLYGRDDGAVVEELALDSGVTMEHVLHPNLFVGDVALTHVVQDPAVREEKLTVRSDVSYAYDGTAESMAHAGEKVHLPGVLRLLHELRKGEPLEPREVRFDGRDMSLEDNPNPNKGKPNHDQGGAGA